MFHPRRSLQDLADGELSDHRRATIEQHLQHCASCADDLSRLRGHKSVLLGLQNPSPDPDFQRRLLSSGSSVARPDQRRDVTGATGIRSVTGVTGLTGIKGATPRRTRVAARRRRALLVAGGTVGVATAILTGAYIVGSGSGPVRAGAATGPTTLRAGWDAMAPGTRTALDADQVESLRAQGWSCPELMSLGFTLRSAEAMLVGGVPTLELVLDHHGDLVTVYEQRKIDGRPADAPINAATGRTVVQDGFDHVGGVEQDLWVRSGAPWLVVLDAPYLTYTVVSELPPADMPQTLQQLVTAEYAQLSPQQPQDDSVMERIVRGLSIIADPPDD